MMAEFYSGSPYILNPRRAAEGFAPLLADDRLGHVWFIGAESKEVGYVVVTLSYSMEYGGPTAVVDDFYIRPAFRGAGLGKLPWQRFPAFAWRVVCVRSTSRPALIIRGRWRYTSGQDSRTPTACI
jgi:GNAT superfamily N-acetyltransferase